MGGKAHGEGLEDGANFLWGEEGEGGEGGRKDCEFKW